MRLTRLVACLIPFAVSLVSAQWLETKITLPDSLGGATGPLCLTTDSSERFVYVGDLGGAVYVVDAEAGARKAKVVTNSPVYAVCSNSFRNKVYAANFTRNNVTVISCAANQAVATVSVGAGPKALCYNSQNDKVYCANYDSDDLTVIDGASDSVTKTIHVGERPSALCYNPACNRIFCTVSDTVVVLDGASDTVVALIETRVWGSRMSVNPVSNRLYVAGGIGVLVLDGTTGVVLDSIATSPVVEMSCNPATNRLYLGVDDGVGSVWAIDGAADSLVGWVRVGHYIRSVACDSVRNRVYVADDHEPSRVFEVVVIDGITNSISARIPVGSNHGALLGSSRLGRMYCTGRDGTELSVLDVGRDSLLHIVKLGGGSDLMCYDPPDDKVYHVYFDNFAEVGAINAATNCPIIAHIPVGQFPVAMLYHAPSSRVYCLSAVSDNLTVIDPRSDTVVKTISVARGSNLMCSVPELNKIYCCAGDGKLMVIDCGGDTVTKIIQVPHEVSRMCYASTASIHKLYCGVSVWPPPNGFLSVIDCVRDTVIRTYYQIPVQHLASGPSGKKVYCALPDSLNVYETGNDTLVAAIPWESAGNIFLCVPGVEKVYCSRDAPNQVLVVDARADSIIKRIPTPWPRALAYDRTTGLVYCARPEAGKVMLIDSRTDSIVDSLSPCTRPESFTMAPAHGRVYVGNGGGSFIPVIRSALPGIEDRTLNPILGGNPRARLVTRNRPLVVTQQSDLLDISGRKVLELKPGPNDVSRLAPGVYFVRAVSPELSAVSCHKVVIAR